MSSLNTGLKEVPVPKRVPPVWLSHHSMSSVLEVACKFAASLLQLTDGLVDKICGGLNIVFAEIFKTGSPGIPPYSTTNPVASYGPCPEVELGKSFQDPGGPILGSVIWAKSSLLELLGSLLFQFSNIPAGADPPGPPFQNVVPASGPVTHFHTPSDSASLPPIQPVPNDNSPAICDSAASVIVTK